MDEIDMPKMLAVAMSDDAEYARNVARHDVTMYLGQQAHIDKPSGVIQSVHDAMGGWPPREGGIEEAMSLVGDDIVGLFSAAGTRDICRARVQEYVEAGASCPVLCPLTPNIREIIDAFAPN